MYGVQVQPGIGASQPSLSLHPSGYWVRAGAIGAKLQAPNGPDV